MPGLDTNAEYINQTFDHVSLEDESIEFTDFEDCVFQNCSFQETRFQGCRFLNCTFSACELNVIQVSDCSFTNVQFENSKVVGVNWTEATWPKIGLLNSIEFENCVLNHSTFMGLNLPKIKMVQCLARDVDFSEANLTLADLSDSDLEKSRFVRTNLTKANLRGAKNYTISPQLNVLKKTHFSLPEAMSLLYSLDIILEE